MKTRFIMSLAVLALAMIVQPLLAITQTVIIQNRNWQNDGSQDYYRQNSWPYNNQYQQPVGGSQEQVNYSGSMMPGQTVTTQSPYGGSTTTTNTPSGVVQTRTRSGR